MESVLVLHWPNENSMWLWSNNSRVTIKEEVLMDIAELQDTWSVKIFLIGFKNAFSVWQKWLCSTDASIVQALERNRSKIREEIIYTSWYNEYQEGLRNENKISSRARYQTRTNIEYGHPVDCPLDCGSNDCQNFNNYLVVTLNKVHLKTIQCQLFPTFCRGWMLITSFLMLKSLERNFR